MTSSKQYPLQQNPNEWYRSVLKRPKSKIISVEWNKTNSKSIDEDQLRDQSNKWFSKTGFKAEESEFAVIIPIHNEAKFIPSLLATLSFANLPSEARIYFIFITNQCKDDSVGMINDLFSHIGNVSSEDNVKTARFLNNYFIHRDISTGGKAIAMNEGLSIAKGFDIRISIVIDANNFIDEYTIPEMFKNAKKYFYEGSDKVYLTGVKKGTYKKSLMVGFVKKIRKFKKEKVHKHRFILVGAWLLCLDTYWITKIGGVPLTTVEDLALGVLAYQDGRKSLRITTATIWGYHSSTIMDKFKEEVRFIKGKYQTIALNKDSDIVPLLQQDTYYLKDLRGRLMFYWQNFKEQPASVFFLMFCFFFWEFAILVAKLEYRKNSTNIAWDSIPSTKE